jgi:asparagine synthase (glutamine-hydrolysing)
MKRALAGILPEDILHRPKRGFGTPMGAWIKGRLAPVVAELLSERSIDRRGWFRAGCGRRSRPPTRREPHRRNRRDFGSRQSRVRARLHLDRRSADDLAAELREFAA